MQQALLCAPKFALGCGGRARALPRVGASPFITATAGTVLVSAVALGGVLFAGPIG